MLASEALNLLCPTVKDISEEIDGVSYSSVRAWRSGNRTPSRDSMSRLSEIAADRAAALNRISVRLEDAAEEES